MKTITILAIFCCVKLAWTRPSEDAAPISQDSEDATEFDVEDSTDLPPELAENKDMEASDAIVFRPLFAYRKQQVAKRRRMAERRSHNSFCGNCRRMYPLYYRPLYPAW